ncbi:methyltransferase domain-containing protein (plasmid) [Peteryoungia desertarenae]|uniref:Methyltransferase domain-containing protein n=1 Tax=Peteryoungia desertarenae TaxID=1813451 RepID=A0ABX6QSZ0_9HYPH|nr:class I SAM-dependent methyltransferase [Peteryoungia desertarenae]QLF71756.1 methyltransferase domain-containing protein [Peteryoungia desertarenae]
MNCRHCSSSLSRPFLDLGFQPPSNAYLPAEALNEPEMTYPLRLQVCEDCWLVQTEDYTAASDVFTADYAYFSSISKGWLDHAKAYSDQMIARFKLGADSNVIEVASNDGYLLRNFVEMGIPCLGIEPTDSTADAAEAIGVKTLRRFFGADLARELVLEGCAADLVAGNNVFAHVPDVNDFAAGLAAILKPEGVITLEFPHLMRLVEFGQFDTVYHEHFSYLSLLTVTRILDKAGLRIFDIEELVTHGGSLRVFACRKDAAHVRMSHVDDIIAEERRRGMESSAFYDGFQQRAEAIKNELLSFLLKVKSEGRSIVAYGAAAKGNTILNFAGVKPDLLPVVYDAAKAKQGKFLPGSHIPILSPDALRTMRPDYVLILPWNIADEVIRQNDDLRQAGTRFVTAVPELKIV